MRILFLIILILHASVSLASAVKDSISIRGVGSYYKNSPIELLVIDDYITHKEVVLQTSKVDSVGYFEFKFKNIPTQKLVIRSKKNSSFIYVQPGGKYLITLPEKNEYDEKNENGNFVDVVFYQLDSTDINYKILNFDRWLEKELGEFYHLKKVKSEEYEKKYESLKKKADNFAKKDTNLFFLYHVKFSLAEMDDLEAVSSSLRIQNYAKWFHKLPVYYRNDSYMNYFNIFYENLLVYLKNSQKDMLYDAVINRSPTLAMKALGDEETLKNIQVRELALIKLLYEQCYDKRYPKTNLLFMLDSIRLRSRFADHRKVASNSIDRVTELSIGSRFPEFQLFSQNGDTISTEKLEGKHVYLHFFDPTDDNCMKELQPLVKLHNTYGDYIQFISIQVKKTNSTDRNLKLPWPTISISEEDNFIKSSKIKIYPTYILLDATGNIVAIPALKPVPNSEYQTIEPLFFQIKRSITGERRRK
jgi:peroxiredoxin